jgi:hypothetical protein
MFLLMSYKFRSNNLSSGFRMNIKFALLLPFYVFIQIQMVDSLRRNMQLIANNILLHNANCRV